MYYYKVNRNIQEKGDIVEFITTGEKIKRVRKQLAMTQDDLQVGNVTRGLISMIETDNRELTYWLAIKMADKFNKKAIKLGFAMNINADYLMRSPNEDAELYCLTQLKDTDISYKKIHEILRLSEQYNLIEVKAKVYFKMGQADENNKRYDEACEKYDKAIKLYKNMNKEKELPEIYLRMGSCKDKILKYDAAIIYYNSSQYYSIIHNNNKIQKLSLYNLAIEYKKTNKIALALENVEKYLSSSDEEDPYYYFGFNTKANCYEVVGDYNKAIVTYKELLNKIATTDKPILGYVYNNLGLNYCHKNDFEESLKYFEMAEKFRSKFDKVNLGVTLIEKSTVLLKQNLYKEAIETIDEGLNYSIEYNNIEYLIRAYCILAEIYEKLNALVELEDVYKKLIELLKINNDEKEVKAIYDKIALMYSKQSKPDLCQKYLLLSNNIN